MFPIRTVLATLAALLLACPQLHAQVLTPEQRLAMQLSRAASFIIDADPLTAEAIDKAVLLFQQAAELDPDDPELWRFVMNVANLAERDNLYEQAVTRLLRLQPEDDTVQLRRINIDLERFNTVELRARRYRQLLAPELRDRIGPPLASRLALDLALMLRRSGDVRGFSDALAEAVAIDPSNRAAAAIAAGFFRMNVQDPFAEAELLTNLMLADPTDVVTQTALAELLLENGAYPAAERIYDLVARNHDAVDRTPAPGLLADQALAQWAAGHPELALQTIYIRQKEIDERLRRQALEQNPELNRVELARMHAPIDLTLATVRAAILASQGAEETLQAVARSMEMYSQLLVEGREDGQELGPSETAQIQIRMAWISAWLGNNPQDVQTLLDQARQYKPLNDVADARFRGWIAIHEHRLEDAVSILSPVAAGDPAAGLGLALALHQLGKPKDAARAYLALARANPGSLVGIWAVNRLAQLLNARAPLSNAAQKMNAMIQSISPVFFRFPDSPRSAVDFRLVPRKLTVEPFEPLIIDVQLVNNSPYPLAINRDGPLRPQVAIVFLTLFKSMRIAEELEPIIVDIDRRLRLEPGQHLSVPVDLRRCQLGDVMKVIALRGTLIEVRGLFNFIVSERGVLETALLGCEERTHTIRLEGARVDSDWIDAALQAIADPGDPELLPTLALLSNIAAQRLARATPEQLELQDRVRDAFIDAYPKLDEASQAWLVGMMPAELNIRPSERRLATLRQMVLKDDNALAHLVYLLYQIYGPEDPILQIALASDNPRVRSVAEGYIEMMELQRERARRQLKPAEPVAPPAGRAPRDLGGQQP